MATSGLTFRCMDAVRPQIEANQSRNRSRQTNRPLHVVGDNRTKWARRRRDLLTALIAELGREPSQRDRTLAANTATIIVRAEQLAAQVAAGELIDDEQLIRLSNLTTRMLSALRAESTRPQAQPGNSLSQRLAKYRGVIE